MPVHEVVGLNDGDIGGLQQMRSPDGPQEYGVIGPQMEDKAWQKLQSVWHLHLLDHMLRRRNEAIPGDVKAGANNLEALEANLLEDRNDAIPRVDRLAITSYCLGLRHDRRVGFVISRITIAFQPRRLIV